MEKLSTDGPPAPGEQLAQPLAVMRADEIYNMPEVQEEFLVEGLIPLSGLSLLIAKPKDGKSCLARQLAVDVAQGADFLGRPTMQAGVLYIGLEEAPHQYQRAIKAAGMKNDDPLYSYIHPLKGSANELLAVISATLDKYPEVRLVVVDTMMKLAKVKDLNAYADSQRGLQPWHDLAVSRKITILGLHHNRKAVSADAPSSCNMSGSSAIAAGVNNLIELFRQRPNEASSPRILRMNEYRYGEELEPTILEFDTVTHRYSIAKLLSDAQRQAQEAEESEHRNRILAFIAEHPGIAQDEIIRSVRGRNSTLTKRLLYRMIDDVPCEIKREGDGKKGNPYLYFIAELPREQAA